jgi:hypothetical protein
VSEWKYPNCRPNRQYSPLEVSDRKVLAWYIHDQGHHITKGTKRQFKPTSDIKPLCIANIWSDLVKLLGNGQTSHAMGKSSRKPAGQSPRQTDNELHLSVSG